MLYAINYIESLLPPFRAPTALKELLMNRPRFANFAAEYSLANFRERDTASNNRYPELLFADGKPPFVQRQEIRRSKRHDKRIEIFQNGF